MAAADTTILSKITQQITSVKGQFKQTASANDKKISSISKDLGRHFSSQESRIRGLSSNIDEYESQVQQNASKVNNLENLLRNSISVQNDILRSIKGLVSYFEKDSGSLNPSKSSGLGGAGGMNPATAALTAAGGVGLMALAGSTPGGSPGGASPGGSSPSVPFNGENKPILETIKARESRGDYTIQNKTSSASGAYQFIDSTWKSRAQAAGVDTKMYPRAKDAPPEIQDKVADKYVSDILKQVNNDVSKVPVVWYTGNPQGKNSSVSPEQLQQYVAGWMKEYSKHGGSNTQTANVNQGQGGAQQPGATGVVPGAAGPQGPQGSQGSPGDAGQGPFGQSGAMFSGQTRAPGTPVPGGAGQSEGNMNFPGSQNASFPGAQSSSSGSNGNLSPSSLQSIGGQHKLQPAAAQAYLAMVDAAKQQGISWNITDSYRTYDEQVKLASQKGLYSQGGLAAQPGRSNHGWGTALDLGGGAENSNSEQNKWLQQNASRFGFSTIPREPWHWEYKGGGVDKSGGPGGGQQMAGSGMGGMGGGMGMGGMGGGMGMGGMSPFAALGGMLGGGRGAAIGAIAGAVLPSALGALGGLFGGGGGGGLFGAGAGPSPGGAPQAQMDSGAPMTPSMGGSGSPYGFAKSGSDEDTSANFFAADKRMMEKTAYIQQAAAQAAQPAAAPAEAKSDNVNRGGDTHINNYNTQSAQEQGGSWAERLAGVFHMGKNVQYPYNPVG